MQNKLILFVGLAVIVASGVMYAQKDAQTLDVPTPVGVESAMPVPGSAVPEIIVEEKTESATATAAASSVKEFTMTAYFDDKGKWFSVKEIAVQKGDIVRIKVKNTKGMHDFVLDEYGIDKDLPLNQEVVIEFTADKVGNFVYYCSMPGHREGGQWGTLVVTE